MPPQTTQAAVSYLKIMSPGKSPLNCLCPESEHHLFAEGHHDILKPGLKRCPGGSLNTGAFFLNKCIGLTTLAGRYWCPVPGDSRRRKRDRRQFSRHTSCWPARLCWGGAQGTIAQLKPREAFPPAAPADNPLSLSAPVCTARSAGRQVLAIYSTLKIPADNDRCIGEFILRCSSYMLLSVPQGRINFGGCSRGQRSMLGAGVVEGLTSWDGVL